MRRTALLWFLAGAVALGCSADPDTAAGVGGAAPVGPVQVSGAAQKGPMIQGSSLQVVTLDPTGNPTGTVFNATTLNDLGEFQVVVAAAGEAELIATGFYFNEAAGMLSTSQISLHAMAELTSEQTQSRFVNVFTHMAYRRVSLLYRGGMILDAAVEQAEGELLAGLGMIYPAADRGAGTTMNLLGGDSAESQFLFALSCALAEAALLSGGAFTTGDAQLQQMINDAALDLEPDGELNGELAEQLGHAQTQFEASACAANLAERLQDIGSSAVVPDIAQVWDFDQDGVADAQDDDLDGDGFANADDCAPFDPTSGALLLDGNCYVDDDDDDDDGRADAVDCEPLDPSEPPPGLAGPWCDPGSGLCWIVGDIRDSWAAAGTYCDELSVCGDEDWRLPTISELRTIVRGCAALEPGGSCALTDQCLSGDGCYTPTCSDSGCAANAGPTDGCYVEAALATGPGITCHPLWSSSQPDPADPQWCGTDAAWLLEFVDARIGCADESTPTHYAVACARAAAP